MWAALFLLPLICLQAVLLPADELFHDGHAQGAEGRDEQTHEHAHIYLAQYGVGLSLYGSAAAVGRGRLRTIVIVVVVIHCFQILYRYNAP